MIPNRLIRREMQKKNFFWRRRKSAVNGGGGGPAAFFLKDTKTLGNYWLNQKDFIQLSLKLSD